MDYIVSESQDIILTEEPEEILEFSFRMFNKDWDFLQEYLDRLGNPPYKIIGDLDLRYSNIKSLGNLQSVRGYLELYGSEIQSLGNLQHVGGGLYFVNSKIQSLGNLQSVGGSLYLDDTNIQSLGNLQSVEGNLYLRETPLSKKTTEEEIRKQVEVKGDIYL